MHKFSIAETTMSVVNVCQFRVAAGLTKVERLRMETIILV